MLIDLNHHPDCNMYGEWSGLIASDRKWAVLDLSGYSDIEDYISKGMNATARNRFRFSTRSGYQSMLAGNALRNECLDAIHEINNSADIRQGRVMSKSYRDYPAKYTSEPTCDSHFANWVFTFKENKLLAYITANHCGELSAASQLLGHANYLHDGIMLNAWVKFIEVCIQRGTKFVIYGEIDSGTEGLRYWKHSVGLSHINLEEIK